MLAIWFSILPSYSSYASPTRKRGSHVSLSATHVARCNSADRRSSLARRADMIKKPENYTQLPLRICRHLFGDVHVFAAIGTCFYTPGAACRKTERHSAFFAREQNIFLIIARRLAQFQILSEFIHE